MKKKIWYCGQNVRFFDSEPNSNELSSNEQIGNFTVDTNTGDISGLDLNQTTESVQSGSGQQTA